MVSRGLEKKTLSVNYTVVRVKTVTATNSTKTHSSKRVLNLFDTAEKCLLQMKKEQEKNKAFFKKHLPKQRRLYFHMGGRQNL